MRKPWNHNVESNMIANNNKKNGTTFKEILKYSIENEE